MSHPHKHRSGGGLPPALPNLSLAETRHKAEQYSLAGPHPQTNAAAKQAILQELHSSMQLRAERIRIHRRHGDQSGDSHPHGGEGGIPSPSIKGETAQDWIRPPEGRSSARHVTFDHGHHHESPDLIRNPAVRSRIPVSAGHVHSRSGSKSGGPRASRASQQNGGRGSQRQRGGRGGDGRRPDDKGVEYTYSWHQKGRLNELRIRFLARKFFTLWRRNAFTQVKPSVIRAHYNGRLLRRAFSEWKEYWWTQRREWSLLIRAEYHHRYKMYQHVWFAWRAFIVREKVKNAKREIAENYASQVLVGKAVAAWRAYIQQRKAKMGLQHRAERFYARNTVQHHWGLWRDALRQRREYGEAEVYALQYWADSTTHKAWAVWKQRYQERQALKQREREAQAVHEKTLVARCFFQGLLCYTKHRQQKKQAKARACQLHTARLLSQAWAHWHQRWFTHRSLAQRQEQVDGLADRSRLRRALNHWTFYTDLIHVERATEQRAVEHYNKQLKKLGLLMLRLAVVRRRMKARRTEQAEELHQEILVKRCWNRWLVQCEHKEELRLFAATRKARLLHRKRLLGVMTQRWCHYTSWRRHRKDQYLKADDHYARQALLPKCLHTLRLNAQLQQRKRDLAQQATDFYREGLLGQTFYRWQQQLQVSQDLRMMDRMALLHNESVLVKTVFQEWRERTRLKLEGMEKMYLACKHYKTTLRTQALCRWMEFTREARQRSRFERLAAHHAYMQAARRAWTAWREYVLYRRCAGEKNAKADSHCHGRQMKRTFAAWRQHCEQMHSVYQDVAERERVVNGRQLRYVLLVWQEYAAASREDRGKEETAESHWSTRLCRKVMTVWNSYAQQHAADSAVKSWRLQQLQAQLQKAKLRRMFLTWHQNGEASAKERMAVEKAEDFRCKRLKMQCLEKWKEYRLLCLKKALILRQAQWLNKIRMQTRFFTRWKKQCAEAHEESRKTVMALWLWSMRLQQRTLHALIVYARERRRKKARVAAALERRREDLLKEGMRQWLMVAGALGGRRASLAARHHAESSVKSYQVVRRCAYHWRQKTLAHRERRCSEQPLPRPSGRRVTFADDPSLEGQGAKVQAPIAGQRLSMGRKRKVPKAIGSGGLPVLSVSAESRVYTGGDVEGLPTAPRPVTGKVRPQPRRPGFLRDSLQRAGLWTDAPDNRECHPNQPPHGTDPHSNMTQASQPEHPSQTHRLGPAQVSAPIPTSRYSSETVPLISGGEIHSLFPEGRDPTPPSRTQAVKGERGDEAQDKVKNENDILGNRPAEIETRSSKTLKKSPLLLPPSAFMADAPPSQSKGSERSLLGGDTVRPPTSEVLREESRPGRWTGSQRDDPRNRTAERNVHRGDIIHPPTAEELRQETDRWTDRRTDIQTGTDDWGEEASEMDVYGEIQRLKTTLQGYQDTRTKLKKLRSQEVELRGWLKDLHLPSSVDDSAALLIADEINQVEAEIASLSTEVRQSKPHIRNLLARIQQLTQTATR